MSLDRRDFLKVSAGTTGLILLNPSAFKAITKGSPAKSSIAMLVDVSKCVGCWWCYAACKDYNKLKETIRPEPEQAPRLSSQTWTTLFPLRINDTWSFRKQACNHCTDAACVEVCPTGALSYNELGFVQYDKEKCCGCGYCAESCPFAIPQLDSDRVTGLGLMDKCTFCKDRVTNGQPTACADACPTGAIQFGNRSELLEQAKQRAIELSETNPKANIYGGDELRGLHVMYVLDDSPATYGLPVDPQVPASAAVRNVFKWVGVGAALAAIAGFGLNYLVARIRIARGERK